MEAKKIHFHSFDAFRFFAFFKVFIFHVPLVLGANSDAFKQWFSDHIRHGGGVGVSFFFVLSGFLITYILTVEKINKGKINLKRFFVRRAFRIWPLFYLLVILALVIPPDFASEIGFHMNWGGYDPDWRFSLTFTENYKAIIMDGVPRTTPLSVFWSLCIEEHFYIVWMLAFFFIKRKYIPWFLVFSIVTAWVFRIFGHEIYHTENITTNDLFTNMDYFAISGLLGYMVAVNYEKVADFVLKIPLAGRYAYIGLVLVILLFLKNIFGYRNEFLRIFQYTLIAIMFTGLLLVFIPQNENLKIGDKNIFTRLGKISYGLYVYHIIWIHVVLQQFIIRDLPLDNWPTYGIFVAITFCGTVLTSYLSYRFFEMPILKWRERIFPS